MELSPGSISTENILADMHFIDLYTPLIMTFHLRSLKVEAYGRWLFGAMIDTLPMCKALLVQIGLSNLMFDG
jgi:hypothetical protein